VSKRIYRFGGDDIDGDVSMVGLLGGKGANLAEMCHMGLPVPPGFTITTDECNSYLLYDADGRRILLDDLLHEVLLEYLRLSDMLGYQPLVSVRSGAPVSMPGMMDTILNVGLTSGTFQHWHDKLGARAAYDSKRRLIQMLGSTAYGIPHEKFEALLTKMKFQKKVKHDTELNAVDLLDLCEGFEDLFETEAGLNFPGTVELQLRAAIRAVFDSWNSERAITYRKLNNIDPSMGTACTVQAMVFGNMGDDSGTGVLFTRNPATGQQELMGEFLQNAQGEDVVAGIRTPLPIAKMKELPEQEFDLDTQTWNPMWPGVYEDLQALSDRLEAHYLDMMDIEFTVQQGKLWVLQCRAGKRSALAAVKIARQFYDTEEIDEKRVFSRITRAQYKFVTRPMVDPNSSVPPQMHGNGASPGVARGKVVISATSAINCTVPCVLVTHETSPDDIAGMAKAEGILTRLGGATSHAAVVARAMNKPCVVGCVDLPADLKALDGRLISICGTTGRIWLDYKVPVIDSSDDEDVQWLRKLALEHLQLAEKVVPGRAPADAGKRVLYLVDYWDKPMDLIAELQYAVEIGAQSQTVVNFSFPHKYLPADDKLYDEAFGQSTYVKGLVEKEMLTKSLLELHEPKGMVIVGGMTPELRRKLQDCGYVVAGKAETVADLFTGAAEVSPEFISKVIGGEETWAKLQQVLAASGVVSKAVPTGVPIEYAVFTALES
jgi:pyruvate,phosphate dikinase